MTEKNICQFILQYVLYYCTDETRVVTGICETAWVCLLITIALGAMLIIGFKVFRFLSTNVVEMQNVPTSGL